MNRAILKHGRPITALILAVFALVVYRRIANGEIMTLAIAATLVWALGTPAFIYLRPRLTVGGYKRAIRGHGLGGGPIPVNTLYAVPTTSSTSASRGSLLATGTDDLLYIGGWLDLRKGPQVLHVPEMGGRYYSVQFTDPSTKRKLCLCRSACDGNVRRRLCSQRTRLERNCREWPDPNFFAK